jgi:hypothetical protein
MQRPDSPGTSNIGDDGVVTGCENCAAFIGAEVDVVVRCDMSPDQSLRLDFSAPDEACATVKHVEA